MVKSFSGKLSGLLVVLQYVEYFVGEFVPG